MNNRQQAEKIVSEHQAAKARYAQMGMIYSHPLGTVTVDELEAHMNLCQTISRQHGGVTIKWEQFLGKSEADITAVAKSKVKSHHGRKAFAKLETRYGKDIAKKIISK